MVGIWEACAGSLVSARVAITGGADRLELCSVLTAGNLIPYAELPKGTGHRYRAGQQRCRKLTSQFRNHW